MSCDTHSMQPRGRPPAGVLLTLTGLALVVHGCVLGSVPLASLPTSAEAAQPVTSTVQVRQIAPPPPAPIAALDQTDPAPSTPPAAAPKKARAVMPLALHVAQLPASAPELAPSEPSALIPAALVETPPAVAAEGPTLRQPERPVPVYKTRIPPMTTIEYEIRRGGLSGTGALSWRPTGGHYEMRLEASIAGFTLLTQISQGGFDTAGLAPLRFTDQRARKAARAANFQRDAGKVTFSGPPDEYALAAGSQDRLSWMIQLPAVLAGEPKRAAAGGEVVLYIAGARGDMDLWDLHSGGLETIDTPTGALQTVKFTRTPRTARDTQAEVWLDPKRHYLPVRARLVQGDSDTALDLMLRELHTGP